MPVTVKDLLEAANAAVPRISPEEAKALVGRPDVLFVDVRDGTEVAKGKIQGAVHAQRGLIEFKADPEAPSHDKAFDRSKTIITYCASGGRSALAGKTLKDMGYEKVMNLGGFAGWVEAGGEVEP
ncbi:MAG TPA: rhodanese-like domain-containing protein [Acetobacteraceae bacterium]|nr:rhodanese-like domain-containing protein [Acetobacteraceae bacterium]